MRRRGCRHALTSESEVVAGPGSIWSLTMAPASDPSRRIAAVADTHASPTKNISSPTLKEKRNFKVGVEDGAGNRVFDDIRFPGS